MSHRWGRSPQLVLDTVTSHSLYSGVPSDSLQPLFRDIIDLVFRLGLDYLWIDTLCIKQDDARDWEAHAVSMHFIYMHSSLNVTASFSSHDQSLYWSRKELLATDLHVQTLWQDSSQLILGSRDWNARERPRPLSKQPIVERGWVFQERLLSPRVIHFTDHLAVWECRQTAISEFGVDLIQSSNKMQQRLASLLIQSRITAHDIHELWTEIVCLYSETITTFEQDRLYALAGIASLIYHMLWNRVEMPMNQGYAAGMWHHGLHFQLAWSVVNNNHVKQRLDSMPGMYRAPSWSWTSVNGPVGLDRQALARTGPISLIEIPDDGIRMKTTGSIFGPAEKGSSLMTWANLCRVQMEPMYEDNGYTSHQKVYMRLIRRGQDHVSSNDMFQSLVYLDDRSSVHERSDILNGELFCMPLLLSPYIATTYNWTGNQQYLSASDVEAAILWETFTWDRLSSSFDDADTKRIKQSPGDTSKSAPDDPMPGAFMSWTSLLLQPVESQKGQYVRIGLLQADFAGLKKSKLESIASAFRNSGLSAARDEVLPMSHPSDPSVYLIEIV